MRKKKKFTAKWLWAKMSLCQNCGSQPVSEGKTRCTVCIEAKTQATRDRANERLARGKCMACGTKPHEPGKKLCLNCAEQRSRTARTRVREVAAEFRQKVLDHYGAKCACCGESNPVFLTIDHINNDGAQHRKEVPASKMYRWLVQSQFPEGYQLLCFNCNCGRQRNGGICPHQGEGFPYVSPSKIEDVQLALSWWRPKGWPDRRRRK